VNRGQTSIPVFYSERMLAETNSFSLSAGKPRHVLSAWQRAGFPIHLGSIEPVSEMDFSLAHDPAYVQGILSAELPNGFGNTSRRTNSPTSEHTNYFYHPIPYP